jgi:hypothetical protein
MPYSKAQSSSDCENLIVIHVEIKALECLSDVRFFKRNQRGWEGSSVVVLV